MNRPLHHPQFSRRFALQAGSIGLLGLGANHLAGLREAVSAPAVSRPKSVIYIFLSGGLGQHDSFDPKPEAPAEIRGEFSPIATATPGVFICEHLPLLARCSQHWSLIRSLTHPYNEHSEGHHVMLTGRTMKPVGFNASKPQPSDWPCLPAIVADRFGPGVNNLPPAVILPERLIHRTGRVIPGQFAGQMGAHREPWFVEAVPFNSTTYGAFPEYEFHHARGRENAAGNSFQAPNLTLPHELTNVRLNRRRDLLANVELQQAELDRAATIQTFDRHRQAAVSLLTDPRVKHAFDVRTAPDEIQEKYGRNSFGWSLLMARRLVESGVRLVQVNLGNNETWDTHGNAFPHLRDLLYPPTDRALSALLDDLHDSGLLKDTLVVMAGEFGRTPKISHLTKDYAAPGRDHWGAVQSVFLAGGGVVGGRVIGATDKQGGFPIADAQTPENLAATIYDVLGIPDTAVWQDDVGRPHHVYYGTPIRSLFT